MRAMEWVRWNAGDGAGGTGGVTAAQAGQRADPENRIGYRILARPGYWPLPDTQGNLCNNCDSFTTA